jgi:hypothetical protein
MEWQGWAGLTLYEVRALGPGGEEAGCGLCWITRQVWRAEEGSTGPFAYARWKP